VPNYIIVRTKSQLSWLNLPHLPILPLPITAKQEPRTSHGTPSSKWHRGY